MKKYLLMLLTLVLPGLAFSADAKPSPAASSPSAQTSVVFTPVPTPKPLYIDYQPPEWAKGWGHITLQQAQKLHKDSKVLFLDARPKVEYDQDHIAGALPFPAGETEKYYAMYEGQIKKAKKLVTYCHGIGCRLSEKAAQALVAKGYKNVTVFFGGEPQWREAKLPFESGDSKAPKSTPTPAPAADAQSASSNAKTVSPAAK